MIKMQLLRLWQLLPSWLRWAIASSLAHRYRVAVAALILNPAGEILLSEHTYRRPYPWGLPGGDLEPGEEVARAVEREVLEETGLKVQVIRLLMVTNSQKHSHVALIFLCKPLGGAFVPNAEVSTIRFYKADELPELLLPSEREVIAHALGLLENPADRNAMG